MLSLHRLIPLLLSLTLPFLLSCKQEKQTPHWEQTSSFTQASPPPTSPQRASTPPLRPTNELPSLRILCYNLENYLSMTRHGGQSRTKPEREIQALIDVILSSHPDIIGMCEIGTEDNLIDLQSRLKSRGLDCPYAHLVKSFDKTRRLAILSRYPIIATHTPPQLTYNLNGKEMHVSRGFLDATVRTPFFDLRLLGAHLKSKREVPFASQELMRRHESLLLERYANTLLTQAPHLRLLVYGDLNDTKRSKSIRTLLRHNNHASSLHIVELADSRGEKWTQHWEYQDIYSRIDYALLSSSLLPHLDKKESSIIDIAQWEQASDHRALLIVLKP